jgi:hypothetical protein
MNNAVCIAIQFTISTENPFITKQKKDIPIQAHPKSVSKVVRLL